MPRQRGGPARAPSRPSTAPPPRSAPMQQSRPASTASVPARTVPPPPPATQQAQAPGSQGPGLFGQMASTAAGVAVGSTVGHMVGAGISGLFGGGSSAPAAEAQQAPPPAETHANAYGDRNMGISCEADVKSFTKCMNDHQGDMSICQWYLDQLKACQNMAKQY